MGKTNPRKKLWVDAVRIYIVSWLMIYGLNIASKATVEMLDFFAGKARERKTAKDRNAVWYEGLRDYIVKQMIRLGIAERKSEHGITHYMLVPDLTMGKNEAGMRRFQNLIDIIGIEEAEKLVNVTERHFPAYDVEVTVRDPRFHDGEEQSQTESVEELTDMEYTFVSTGSTMELLFWTVALGNKPSFDVGPAPKRVKEGKQRRQR
jgi:hypothetical protein